MDATEAREQARRWSCEADRLGREAAAAGDLAQVYQSFANGWTSAKFAEYMAGVDVWPKDDPTLPEHLDYAERTASEIWAAVERGDEVGAMGMAYELREHFRKLLDERESDRDVAAFLAESYAYVAGGGNLEDWPRELRRIHKTLELRGMDLLWQALGDDSRRPEAEG